MDSRKPDKTPKGLVVCPQCGAAFTCGVAAGEARCWCFDLPNIMPMRADSACLCPACLRDAIKRANEVQQ